LVSTESYAIRIHKTLSQAYDVSVDRMVSIKNNNNDNNNNNDSGTSSFTSDYAAVTRLYM